MELRTSFQLSPTFTSKHTTEKIADTPKERNTKQAAHLSDPHQELQLNTVDMAEQGAPQTADLTEPPIPTIELRAATFNETSKTTAELEPSPSPVPSSPGLTACENSSTIGSEDGIEYEELDDQQREKMIADIFSQLDQLVGLAHVKAQFREIKERIETYQKQSVNLQRERFHIKFLGNPGTGKYWPPLSYENSVESYPRQNYYCALVRQVAYSNGNPQAPTFRGDVGHGTHLRRFDKSNADVAHRCGLHR